MNTSSQQFENQTYLNLETFRKNGTGVKTPVWFVNYCQNFYVRTLADSWKVKRIRKNPQVKIVPCKVQGEPLGEWIPATARQIDDVDHQKEINRIFNRKYGLKKRIFDLMGKLRQHKTTTLEIDMST